MHFGYLMGLKLKLSLNRQPSFLFPIWQVSWINLIYCTYKLIFWCQNHNSNIQSAAEGNGFKQCWKIWPLTDFLWRLIHVHFHEEHLSVSCKLILDSHFRSHPEDVTEELRDCWCDAQFPENQDWFCLSHTTTQKRTKLWLGQHLITPSCIHTSKQSVLFYFWVNKMKVLFNKDIIGLREIIDKVDYCLYKEKYLIFYCFLRI